ncbi:aminotransferase [Zychaea mexicana]|uniref:aminotransferase n=1 Tax=Zychaea mexicana TaxID=64656 RepID=UPI0022FEE788|nr:aminotransferase [Zychaea mexicana]KAI9495062.1 aminotransferase [Zychaea mexicana]
MVHKTTLRNVYNDARTRAGCGQKTFDVVLWNKQRQITETSIANIAIQTEGDRWITPSLQCGLLPGVFRDKLFSSDENIVEGVISVDDLINAQKSGYPIVCFNSVRKAYRVQLVDLST